MQDDTRTVLEKAKADIEGYFARFEPGMRPKLDIQEGYIERGDLALNIDGVRFFTIHRGEPEVARWCVDESVTSGGYSYHNPPECDVREDIFTGSINECILFVSTELVSSHVQCYFQDKWMGYEMEETERLVRDSEKEL